MAKRPLVTCRICKKRDIDRDTMIENVDWINPSTNYYYHVKCYEDFKKKKNDLRAELDDDIWYVALKDYLYKDLKCPINFTKLTSQWEKYKASPKYSAKGIYFAMRYFYDVQKQPIEKGDGIGIIPYIYSDSCTYWYEREQRENGICAKIEAQVMHANEQKHITIKQKAPTKKEDKIDLASIAEMEDDE